MNNAELYHQGNTIIIRDAEELIPKYMNVDHWKGQGENVLDVGCGPGDITSEILRRHIPKHTKILGADISDNMLAYASKKYPDIEFFHLDIGTENISESLIGAFDHVFSSYCLHWIQDQRLWMKNMYHLLKPGGDFFTMYLIHTPFYDAIRKIGLSKKWAKYIQNPKVFAYFQYEKLDSIEEQLENMLKKAGFKVSVCKAMSRNFTFPNIEALRTILSSVNPYSAYVPPNLREELFEETLQEEIRILNIQDNKDIVLNYDIIVINATKI